jgi:hypothetical protein
MKKLLFIPLLLILGSCEIRTVVTANFSKEFCSCLFVVKRSKESCYNQAKQFITPTGYEINDKLKTVSARFLGAHSVFGFESQKYGCQEKAIN